MIDLAVAMKAQRVEVANVQYYGWGIRNRRYLMPGLAQLKTMDALVKARIAELQGVIVIDYVVPDYYAARPKACMNGWGRRFINITPEGLAMPCHAAETIPGLKFDNVSETSLQEIWTESGAFNRFRGTEWMPEPCQSCDRREIDWAGCRCQALALTGDAANPDPVCELVPGHAQVLQTAFEDSRDIEVHFDYRNFGGKS
jgi:pyrroloquinoline quinone biosynthesis protein E